MGWLRDRLERRERRGHNDRDYLCKYWWGDRGGYDLAAERCSICNPRCTKSDPCPYMGDCFGNGGCYMEGGCPECECAMCVLTPTPRILQQSISGVSVQYANYQEFGSRQRVLLRDAYSGEIREGLVGLYEAPRERYTPPARWPLYR